MTWEPQPIPGGWEFIDTEHGARIIIDYLVPVGRGLEAWVELRVDGTELPLSSGTRNLMLAGATAPFLTNIPESDPIRWAVGLQQAFYQTIETWRKGSDTLDLVTVEPQDINWLVDPLVNADGSTRLIAAGGSGKSLLAMAIALTVSSGSHKFLGLQPDHQAPVLYLDWETNANTHARVIRALCGPVNLSLPERGMLMYRNEAGNTLTRSAQAVRRAADQCGAEMIIIDSSKMAAGVSQTGSGEDTTLGLFAAIGQIGRPAVIVDHKSAEAIRRERRGGYGSVISTNLSRLEWEFIKSQQVNPTTKRFVLSLEKENNVGPLPPLGFQLVTTGGSHGIDSARFTRVDPSTIHDPTINTVTDRLLALFDVSTEPMSVKRINEMVPDVSASALRSALSRDKRFVNVTEGESGKTGLWRPLEEHLVLPQDDGFQDHLEEPPPVEEYDETEPVDNNYEDEAVVF